MRPEDFKPALIESIAAHAVRTYPAECCGVIISDAAGAFRYVEIDNIAGSDAAAPASARTVRDGYVMDPKALLAALAEADRTGGALVAIVHSHPDVGAYFSSEDQRAALGGGDEPLWPGVAYAVISCRGGTVDDARLYTWDPSAREFREAPLALAR